MAKCAQYAKMDVMNLTATMALFRLTGAALMHQIPHNME